MWILALRVSWVLLTCDINTAAEWRLVHHVSLTVSLSLCHLQVLSCLTLSACLQHSHFSVIRTLLARLMQLASTHCAYLFLNRWVTLAGKLVSSPCPSLWPGFEVLISLFITHCNPWVGGAAKHSCPDVDMDSAVKKKNQLNFRNSRNHW